MKAILTFNLEEPEDRDSFKLACNAQSWYFVCFELDRELRDMIKYRGAGSEVETVRIKLHSIMEEHGVSLEDVS